MSIIDECCEMAVRWVELKEAKHPSVDYIGINDYIKQNISTTYLTDCGRDGIIKSCKECNNTLEKWQKKQ
jgi:hypothetical protein